MDNLKISLINALFSIGISLIGLLSAFLIYYISKLTNKLKIETQKISDDKQRELIQNALDRIKELSQNTVLELQQTVVEDLKKEIEKGNVNKEELLNVGNLAVKKVMHQLSEDTLMFAEMEISDIKAYITSIVESEVLKLKKS